MAYSFDFPAVFDYTPVLVDGVVLTAALTVVSTVAGVSIGIAGAAARTSGVKALDTAVGVYVEVIRNTPFLVQLFFIFFGLPTLGIRLPEWQAAVLAMVVNLGAYSTEIIRAGIQATPRGLIEAGESLAMTRAEIFRHIVIKPAMKKIWPALSSQIVIVMLGSSVCSQIAAEELTFAANFIQSRNFRPFEVYFVVTALYLGLAVLLRWLLARFGNLVFARRAARA
ncbi:amino acid ABC transporter permease [Azospirillum sp. RWY-5-1]|uniref:Amino acid ABC transporter permease n=1 Tax=Azospirillum oleiclasticum TaxID=2735135 RepID=A0ABX2T9Y6_9PROT|nr:amino acid ABC transporter permease [Azospirillum oleiclasticum]NYZ12644.1 amino acid ABC transporter permease [Azospirillum oleiclasticum]NYZ19804.1 amino acid ABC transporter permease [Azospirillum oleiclasticum]